MLHRTRWAWQARASTPRLRLSPPWSIIAQRRCLASSANEGNFEPEDRFDEHEYYQAAEDFDDELPRRDAGPARRNITAMGTVSVQSPRPDKIEELISQIQPQNIGKASLPNTLPSILLLLLTPAMAQHALSADLPLRVLQQLGENPTASKPLEAITAVVDRLPVPDSSAFAEQGIGYHFSTSPGPLPTFSQVPLQSSTQKPGSLTFQLPRLERWHDCEPALQLPLSHTIFSTGLPSTMVHMRYEFDPLSGLLRKSSSQRLEAQTVRVPIGTQDARFYIKTPLVPLTPLRRVVNSMGNIVRNVSDKMYNEEFRPKSQTGPNHNLSADSMPASQELEAAVTEYFKLNNIPPEPVQVWALVVPPHTFGDWTYKVANPRNGRKNRSQFLRPSPERLRSTWLPHDQVPYKTAHITASTTNREFNKLIGKGARLCQVLSGGGGWGKKAGLISLDPDTAYSTRDLRAESGWSFDFDNVEPDGSFDKQQQQALGDIVREGDGIMLFLAPKIIEQVLNKHPFSHGADRSVIFGVSPSSIDDDVGNLMNEPGSDIEQRVRHHPNEFGMLSEGGMALTATRNGEIVTQTKLDVPRQLVVFMNDRGTLDLDEFATGDGHHAVRKSGAETFERNEANAREAHEQPTPEDSASSDGVQQVRKLPLKQSFFRDVAARGLDEIPKEAPTRYYKLADEPAEPDATSNPRDGT